MKNNILKRVCILILAFCLVSGNMVIHVSANETQTPPATILAEYVDVPELRAYLFEGFKECSADYRIELSQFNIPDADEVKQALRNFIWMEMPESFHVDYLKLYNKDGILTAVTATSFRFIQSKDQYLSMIAECEKSAAVLLDGIIDNDSLSDAEKALLIHDRLAVYCSYCSDASIENCHTIYGALGLGIAVCDGYSHAYSYLLRLAGIENIHCSSEMMNHSWNLVLIDGDYYHVDVTWDDPICYPGSKKGNEGYVLHNNFLLSDKEIKARGHNGLDFYDTLAPNTKYDNYFWHCSETEFQLVNGQIYYFDKETAELKRLNEDGMSGTALWQGQKEWSIYWPENYTRLSGSADTLFLTSSDAVYVYNFSRNEAVEVFRPELQGRELIFGFKYSDGYLICDVNNGPTGSDAKLRRLKQLYTPEITVKLTSTTDMQSKQTVTADIFSNSGISGYYFGQNSEYGEEDIVTSSDFTHEFTVTEPGTYYFAAFDGNGESSGLKSLTFCLVNLHTDGGVVACDKILTEKNNTFTLPAPEKDDATFCGWTDNADGEEGVIEYIIENPPLTSDVYALYIAEVVYTVRFYDYDGALISEKTYRYGEQVEVPEAPVHNESAGEFKGWDKEVAVCTGDADYTAVYNDVVYTVRFIDIDGDIISEKTYHYGDKIEVPADPHNNESDHKFVGWDKEITDCFGDVDYNAVYTNPDHGGILIPGDTNGDGEKDNKDVVVLFRYVSGGLTTADEEIYDYNGDHEVNNKDVVSLFRALSTT